MATSNATPQVLKKENTQLKARVTELELSVEALNAEKQGLENELLTLKQDFEVIRAKAEELLREKRAPMAGRQIINRAIERQKELMQLNKDKTKSL